MRSKEVDKKIHLLKSYAGMTHKLTDNQGRPKLDQAIETVLAYIEELENARSPYFIPKAIIRIKIEEYKMKKLELYKKDLWKEPEYTILKLKYENYIEVLKELLEEK